MASVSDSTSLSKETPETLAMLLGTYWRVIAQNTALPERQIAQQSLLSPARCCLKNIGQVGAADEASCQIDEKGRTSSIEEGLVERAFAILKELSPLLGDKNGP